MCQPEDSYSGGPYTRLVDCVIALFVGMQGIPKEPGNIHWHNAPRDDMKWQQWQEVQEIIPVATYLAVSYNS